MKDQIMLWVKAEEQKRRDLEEQEGEDGGLTAENCIITKYPKNIAPFNLVLRSTYRYVTRMKILIYHPYRTMAYENAKDQRIKI